jgi:hypothetical protein
MDAHFAVSLQSQTSIRTCACKMAGLDQEWQQVLGVALTVNQSSFLSHLFA